MSRHLMVVIKCDGCGARFTTGADRADATRCSAAKEGWRHEIVIGGRGEGRPAPSYDYCPACPKEQAA